MKKTRTIEEVRAKDRERAARWREKNRVLARERVAYVYGKSKYPGMVEERMKPETRAAYKVPGSPERINDVITHGDVGKKIDEEPHYVADPEDARTEEERRVDDQLQAFAAKRRARGIPVEIKL
jgi:hypothetical protein